jgi:hypothetical protein
VRVIHIRRAQVWLKMHLSEQRMDEAAAGRLARLEHRCVLMWQVPDIAPYLGPYMAPYLGP